MTEPAFDVTPLPVAMIISPVVRSRRWWGPLHRATAAIQIHRLGRAHGTTVLRVDLEHAVERLLVERILVCGEGHDDVLPDTFLSAVAAVERELSAMRAERRPRVDAVWLNRSRNQFSVMRAGESAPRFVAAFEDPMLEALFRPPAQWVPQ